MTIKDSVKVAAKRLQAKIGVNVSSGYGFPFEIKGQPEYFLIVFSDTTINVPKVFDGYRVVVREIPRPL